MGSEPNRFLQPQPASAPRLKRWGGCLGSLSCFRKQKGGKRIVPSRVPEGNAGLNQPNGLQAGGLPNQTIGIVPSLYAPPSSPASFSNSALPSTAQSPNCFLSGNSPGGPSSTMYVTGPYAHETQLVSPPVFSTYTTEPSTAPLTPPPELAHLTTPSSPDVPYAHFLSSSANIKGTDRASYIAANDLQATYSLYPGSPASTLRSPISRTPGDRLSSSFNEKELPPHWSPANPSSDLAHTKSESGRFIGLQADGDSKPRRDSNFFCPETFAQFYQDQSSFSHSGGRLSISKESDAYSNVGNVQQGKQTRVSKPDAEELEAYRASFGFSADEIISTTHYVEISDVLEDSFSMAPVTSTKSVENTSDAPSKEGVETWKRQEDFPNHHSLVKLTHAVGMPPERAVSNNSLKNHVQQKQLGDVSGRSLPSIHILSDDDDDIFSNMGPPRICRNYDFGPSNSDAEVEYRRGQKQREERSWRGN